MIKWRTCAPYPELAAERSGCMDRLSRCARYLREWADGGADRCAGYRLDQRYNRIRPQNPDFPADDSYAGLILVRDQRADAGTGFGARARVRGARFLRSVCRGHRTQHCQFGTALAADAQPAGGIREFANQKILSRQCRRAASKNEG